MTPAEVLTKVLEAGGRVVPDPERPRLLVPPDLKPLVAEHRGPLRRLVLYREALRRWWALAARGPQADRVEIAQTYQEILRLIDEVGEPTATRLRWQWGTGVEWGDRLVPLVRGSPPLPRPGRGGAMSLTPRRQPDARAHAPATSGGIHDSPGPRVIPGAWLEALALKLCLFRAEWRVVALILAARDPLTARQLATRLGMAYSAAKRTVRNLTRWGILFRTPKGLVFQPDPGRWGSPAPVGGKRDGGRQETRATL